MSLWFPIMVNETGIGIVQIVRTEKYEPDRHVYSYNWEAEWDRSPTSPSRRDYGPRNRASGHLTHDYRDGAMVLIGKAMEQINLKVLA